MAQWTSRPFRRPTALQYPSRADVVSTFAPRGSQDDAIDVIPIAFVNQFFGTGNAPVLDLANVSPWTEGPSVRRRTCYLRLPGGSATMIG